MKRSYLSKVVGAGVLATSLAVAPLTLPAQAQTTTTPGTDTITAQPVQGDRDFDWGWLGLLGLLGLAGLARRSHTESTQYRDPAQTRQTSDRY